MPDPNPNPNPDPSGAPPANPDPKGGTPPDNNGGNGGQPNPTDIDFSKLSDDQLAKVLEDKRLWNLPRIKELREGHKKAQDYEANKAKEEEERMKKQGEFEALAKTKAEEADSWKNKYQESVKNNKILQEAGKKGITRLDLVDKLIDRSNIKLDDNGEVSGVTEALDALLKDNDFLTSGGKSSLGGGTNPADGNGGAQFTLTQIQDPVFYQKHAAEIMKAQATGNIIDDRK